MDEKFKKFMDSFTGDYWKVGDFVTAGYVHYNIVAILTLKQSGKRYFKLETRNGSTTWKTAYQMATWTD